MISDYHHAIIMNNANRLNSAIIYDRDFSYNYFGFKVIVWYRLKLCWPFEPIWNTVCEQVITKKMTCNFSWKEQKTSFMKLNDIALVTTADSMKF
jgi:hypothetical protein